GISTFFAYRLEWRMTPYAVLKPVMIWQKIKYDNLT
ncbi:MAG: hypothetical protein ACI936_003527, partial [Paraglaciecola sp.]